MWVGGLKAIFVLVKNVDNGVQRSTCIHANCSGIPGRNQTWRPTIQKTLFGRRRSKNPFFSKFENISSSLYYSVIEALWKLSPLDDRKAFFENMKTIYVGLIIRNNLTNETLQE